MKTFIDLNAPDNETRNAYRDLWRAVLLQTFRDATEDAQSAYDAYVWSQSSWARIVCQFAELDYGMIRKFLKEISDSEELRYNAVQKIKRLSFRTVVDKKMNLKRGKYIQKELFACE